MFSQVLVMFHVRNWNYDPNLYYLEIEGEICTISRDQCAYLKMFVKW